LGGRDIDSPLLIACLNLGGREPVRIAAERGSTVRSRCWEPRVPAAPLPAVAGPPAHGLCSWDTGAGDGAGLGAGAGERVMKMIATTSTTFSA
jgi:hypothetical protein